jgi:hypothetical protein
MSYEGLEAVTITAAGRVDLGLCAVSHEDVDINI